jgi:protein-S-isoprenylcysteine O-methyltransferase Ste14
VSESPDQELPRVETRRPAVSEREYNRGAAMLRTASVYLLIAAIISFSRPTPLSVTLGFFIVALGEAIRVWAAGHLRKTVELITSGPYRFTRNPLYLGRLLIWTGLCVMALLPYGTNWIVLALGYVIFFGYYMRRKERVEPIRLRTLHGAVYDRYFESVPVLFPSFSAYPEGASIGWSSDRMLRNREHWMVFGLGLVTLVLLWRAYDIL